jgi:hypothetical protein
MKLNASGILIALWAFSSFAQEAPQQSERARNPCDWNVADALPGTVAGRGISLSGKAKVEFHPVELPRARRKCDFLSIASPFVKQLTRETNARVPIGELISFNSRAAKPGAGFATRTLGQSAQAQDSATDAQELAKKLSNPVASLISFPMQSNFDFGMGAGSGWRYTLNVQPVIPIALSPNWNMISRTIIPIIHQGNVTGPNSSQSGLGDTVQSFFFSPNETEPIIWAVGPVFLLPTATDASLGSQKWGLGPTALALKQKNQWTYGVLANHIWSVAGKSNRGDVSATFVQPFISYTNKQAWTYTINTESTYDWVSNSWSIPINPSISKLVRFGKQPMSFGGGVKCWVTTPTGGPENCGLRIVVTALFPKSQ